MTDNIYRNLLNDLIYDFLVLMSDDSIFGHTEYDKGYVDSLYEAYRMIEEKIDLFEIVGLPVQEKMPIAEEWHKLGSKAIDLE